MRTFLRVLLFKVAYFTCAGWYFSSQHWSAGAYKDKSSRDVHRSKPPALVWPCHQKSECQTLGFLSTCLTGPLRMGEDLGGVQEITGWNVCSLLEGAGAFTGNTDIDLEGASEMASDRKLWREMIRHKREFIGAGHLNKWGDLIKKVELVSLWGPLKIELMYALTEQFHTFVPF